MTVLLNSREPLSDADLKRLHRYSATALSKTEALESMGQVLRPQSDSAAPSPVVALQLAAPGRRVLLVDEDVRLIYSLTAQLDALGLQVVPATSAKEAIARFQEDAFDLVLLDMDQPGVEGPEVTRRLKHELDCQVPIVALTGPEAARTKDSVLLAGVDDVLAKPVEDTALLELVRRRLGLEQGATDAEKE